METRSSSRFTATTSLIALSLTGLFAPLSDALAQGQSAGLLEEVLVTARKKTENIQDVPMTLEAFGEEDIEQFQIESLEDLAGLITSAEFIDTSGNPFDTEVIIRGGGIGRQLNVDGGTGLYANGINVQGGNFGGRSLWDVDTFNAQRFEVLKGPQGALYGRNAMGGAINVISKRPTPDSKFLSLRLGAHKNDGHSVAVDGNLPVIEDKFAVRLAGQYYDQSEGFYFNPVLDEFIDTRESKNLRATALWQISENWDALFQYDYFDITSHGGLTYTEEVTPDPFVRPTDDVNVGTKEEESYYASLTGDLKFAEFNFIVNNRVRDGFRTFDQDEGVSTPVFDRTTQVPCYTVGGPARPVPGNQRCTNTAESEFDRTSVEARLNGTHKQLDWIVGADWFEYTDVFDFAAEGRSINSFKTDLDNEASSWSLFGGLEYAFTERLTLGAEARYTEEDKDIFYLVVATDPAVAGTVVTETVSDTSFSYQTWTLFGTYELRDDRRVYGRIGTGFRAGGFNRDARDIEGPDGDVAIVPDEYDDERALSYEIGLKTTWFDGALLLNGAVYFVEYDDFLANTNNGLRGVDRVAYVANFGDAELYGAEVESQYRVRDFIGNATLNLSANLAYTEGEIISSPDPSFEGLKLSRVPEWSYGARARLDAPLSGGLTVFGALSYSGQRNGFQNVRNTWDLQEPQLFNGQIGVRGDTWSLAVSGRNLSNESEPLLYEDGGVDRLARNPRTWSIIVAKRFGVHRSRRGAK